MDSLLQVLKDAAGMIIMAIVGAVVAYFGSLKRKFDKAQKENKEMKEDIKLIKKVVVKD